MYRVIPLLALLAACAQAPGMTTIEVAPLRAIGGPIASQADVTAARLSGDWVVVRGFAGAPAGPVPGTRLRLDPEGAALILRAEGVAARLVPGDQPGRWAATGSGWLPSGAFWVLWLDADNRTAVIGRPDGAAAWIMDRNSAGSPDRIAAGRDILDWFGYDLARLEEVSR